MLSTGALGHREGLLIQLVDEEGFEGWGDAAPLPGFSVESLTEVEDAAKDLLANFEEGLIPDALPSLSFARDTALGMLDGQRETELAVNKLPLNSLLGRGAELDAATLAYPAIKLKVGGDPLQEALRVSEICSQLPPEMGIRLDANRAWELDQLLAFADGIDVSRIAYIEEPLVDGRGLEHVFFQSGLRIALDESLLERSAVQADFEEGVSAVILKPTLLGSLKNIAAWCTAAEMRGVERVFSSCFESGVGHWSIGRLALAFAGDCPAGLDTYRAFEEDIMNPGLEADAGALALSSPFGQRYAIRTDQLREVGSWRV